MVTDLLHGLVHDLRIDGETHTFSNAGTLNMNAMTWWDHETDSKWSQTWGRVIRGAHKGVELNLLPFQLTTWGTWVKDHPGALVMNNEVEPLILGFRQRFLSDFVIGLILAGKEKAYSFEEAQQAG